MRIKLITFENKLNKDNNITLTIVKKLSKKIKKLNIASVSGECTSEFLRQNIQNKDYIFIIDTMTSGVMPGTVMTTPLNTHNLKHDIMYTSHGAELMQYLKTSKVNIEGTIISIEVETPINSLDGICKEVYEILSTSIKDLKK